MSGVAVELRPVPPRVQVVAVRACAHPRVRLTRVYRSRAFFRCLSCSREVFA